MIVIAMGGASSRFFAEGWTQPKYELPVGERPLFDLTVESFSRYFGSERFLFVARKEFHARGFIDRRCDHLGISSYEVVELDHLTRGQAESVNIGLDRAGVAPTEPLTIFNIDTIRPDFSHPSEMSQWDGYLEVFRGEGKNWSFAEPAAPDSTRVVRTSEKIKISDLCSTGLYYFARAQSFTDAFSRALAEQREFLAQWKEFYIAPLYNFLIADGLQIHYRLIDPSQVIFSGTPDEYRALCAG